MFYNYIKTSENAKFKSNKSRLSKRERVICLDLATEVPSQTLHRSSRNFV